MLLLWIMIHMAAAAIERASWLRSYLRAQDDFNNFLWNVVMLAMGGSALGAAGCPAPTATLWPAACCPGCPV